MKRPVIKIDREKCVGCGLCIHACAEGALELDEEGKAKLVKEIYCDGLGKCLNICPVEALRIEEEEVPPFDKNAAKERLNILKKEGCCSSVSIDKNIKGLNNWPVQLQLVSLDAPFLQEAKLLIAADCTAFASSSFHQYLEDRVCIITCPKLTAKYEDEINKMVDIINYNKIENILVLIMEVPCCKGLQRMIEQAILKTGKRLNLEIKIIPISS